MSSFYAVHDGYGRVLSKIKKSSAIWHKGWRQSIGRQHLKGVPLFEAKLDAGCDEFKQGPC